MYVYEHMYTYALAMTAASPAVLMVWLRAWPRVRCQYQQNSSRGRNRTYIGMM